MVTFWASALASYFTFTVLDKKGVTEIKEPEKEVIYYEDEDKDRLNTLLLGYGGAGHDGGYLTDVIMLVSINKTKKQITLVSIPRDLWVSIPTQSDKSGKFKINATYAIGNDDRGYPLKEPLYKGEFGGGNMAKKVVGDILGITVKNFVAVDFSSFENIVDLMGGIDVEVPKTFDDYFYPIKGLENETCGFSAEEITDFHQKYSGFNLEKQFTCRYEHLHFDKGVTRMDGATALKFVRSRHSDTYGGDFARGERQNAVLFAAKDKLVSIYTAKSADAVYKEFQNLVKTDVNLQTFRGFTSELGNPKDYSVKHVGLSTDNVLLNSKSSDGQFILVPKEGDGNWVGVRDFLGL